MCVVLVCTAIGLYTHTRAHTHTHPPLSSGYSLTGYLGLGLSHWICMIRCPPTSCRWGYRSRPCVCKQVCASRRMQCERCCTCPWPCLGVRVARTHTHIVTFSFLRSLSFLLDMPCTSLSGGHAATLSSSCDISVPTNCMFRLGYSLISTISACAPMHALHSL